MELWEQVLQLISQKISKPSFDTWLAKTTAEIEDDVIFVTASNEFARDWLQERYKPLIFETVREVAGKTYDIEIVSSDKGFTLEQLSFHNHRKSAYDELKKLIEAQQKKIHELEDRIARLEQK